MPLTHEQRRERRKQMADAVMAGQDVGEVANQFGVGVHTVYAAIQEFRPKGKHAGSIIRQASVVTAVKEGEPIASVATRLGITEAYARALAIQGGAVIPRKHRVYSQAVWDAVDWSQRDVDIARATGYTRERVRQKRRARGEKRSPNYRQSTLVVAMGAWLKQNAAIVATLDLGEILEIGPVRIAQPKLRELLEELGIPYRKTISVYDALSKETILKFATANASGCWEWNGKLNPNGYATISNKGKHIYAHRHVWEMFNGPAGKLHVLHKCDNPSCVNPEHLYAGTAQDNARDRVARSPKHPFFSPTAVEELRCRHKAGESIASLSAETGRGYTTMYRLLTGKSYNERENARQIVVETIEGYAGEFTIDRIAKDVGRDTDEQRKYVGTVLYQMVRDGRVELARPGGHAGPAIYRNKQPQLATA